MSTSWVLILTTASGHPPERVGGLSLALRLALSAQRAGASAIVVGEPGGALNERSQSSNPAGLSASAQRARVAAMPPGSNLLADSRLRIPVLESPPPEAIAVTISANLVVHRDAMAELGKARVRGEAIGLEEASSRVASPYRFDPIVVTDRTSARRAERLLFRSLRKKEDGWTARFLNRHVSLLLSRWLVKTPITPNQVSVVILLVGLAGACLASRGTYSSLLGGAFLFQAQSVLDGCDGEMSRVTYRTSLAGEWLDTIGDDVTNYAFFAAAAWGLFRSTGLVLYLIAGAVTVVAGVIASGLEYRYLIKIGSGDLLKYPGSHGSSPGSSSLSALSPLFKRDTFVLLTFLSAIFALLGPMLVIFSVAAIGVLANVIRTELRLARGQIRPGVETPR